MVLQLKDVMLPCLLGLLIEELGAPLLGFECSEADCCFITINVEKMRMHCKGEYELLWRSKSKDMY